MNEPEPALGKGYSLPLVSIAIPVLDEAENLDAVYARLEELSQRMRNRCEFEFVFSDNHSSDQTWAKLQELAGNDNRVRAMRFSKNVGFQRSILANYLHARGDAVFQIDADLQDPPEMLEHFFDLWQDGYLVVYGVRRKRPEGALVNTFRKFGYWLIDKLSEYPIPRHAGDFRLIDRKVVEVLRGYRTANPYLRGMIASMGMRQKGVVYDRSPRLAGESKFRIGGLIRLGLAGVFNHSVVPLRIATYSGTLLVLLSFFGAVFYFVLKFVSPDLPVGLASIHILVLFGIGFQSLLLGVLGEYLLRIYVILRDEPIALIEQSLNFEPGELQL